MPRSAKRTWERKERRGLLEVRNLSVHYRGAIAVHGVSLAVAQGEAVSIIGPNGAGKTSLLRAISGLVPYDGEAGTRGSPCAGCARTASSAPAWSIAPRRESCSAR